MPQHHSKGLHYPREKLQLEDVERILKACDRRTREGRRNHAWITLMWRMGLRTGECGSLRLCDVDFENGVLTVLTPKGASLGKKPRILGLGDRPARALRYWLLKRGDHADCKPLFCTPEGERYHRSTIRYHLTYLTIKAGLRGRRIHAHMFRHTFAYECAMEGKPLPWISLCLGHSSLAQTEEYLHHLAPAEIISGMRERG